MEAQIIATTELVCPECMELADNLQPEPVYECGDCGEIFSRSNSFDGDSHRCPSCGKFSTKICAEGCPDCAIELELQEGYIYKNEFYVDVRVLIHMVVDNNEDPPSWLEEQVAG